ncbi:YdcF family protein [Paenibacillus sp. DMB20]|uniref:YdcF family protein n=1 Tax=Paenibacillus sp. DMB20 TaxID=1642570 RepID=UPI00069BF72A|nr:YdcF family protein [Paenibacillus sp. DMB20]
MPKNEFELKRMEGYDEIIFEKAKDDYPNSIIVVTGGVPKNGVTEADNMTKWLVEHGVAESRILPENQSTDTVENALFTPRFWSSTARRT